MARSAVRIVIFLVLTGAIVTCFLAMTPRFIEDGLDPSWRAALLQARYLDLGFGNQIIFSGGPLSHVYTRTFSGSFFHEQILAVLLFAVFYVTFFINAVARTNNSFVAIIGLTPFTVSLLVDPLYVGVPLCTSLLGTLPAQRTHVRYLVALGAAASAVATLAKFSVFPMALAGFLVVDALAVRNRRFPVALIVYGLGTAAVFSLTSPNGALVEFLRGSLEVSAGYSEAMSISGSLVEVGVIFAGALMIVGLVAASEFRNARDGELPFAVALGRVVIIGMYLFVCIKGGLVRHDAHALIAWYGLGFAAAAYCAFSWRELSPRFATAFAALAVAGVVFTVGSWTRYAPTTLPVVAATQIAERRGDIANWLDFLSGPRRWLSAQEATQRSLSEQLRVKHPLPSLDGTVDAIPSIQSALIANGLRYAPRPSIQEYATYTHGLIEKNRAFFRSDRAPDFVLMAPEQVDGRYPSFAEGAIWPDLLARYAPRDLVDGIAVLSRRPQPLDLPMRTVQTESGTVGELLVLEPDLQGIIFARIDLQPTLLGRLANVMFKTALLEINIQYTNGSEASYRFLPAIAREGFFLSPSIPNAEAYVELAAGLGKTNPLKVKSFAIRPGRLAKWLWSKQFVVRLDAMKDDALRAGSVRSEMTPRARQRLELLSVVYQAPDAKLGVIPEGLLAHAPTKFSLPLQASRTLDVGFGIVDGAWKDDANTDGVCFRISTASAPTPLWERCLDPKRVAADRGPQQATITIPEAAGTVELETACGKNCFWDWSYWSRISLH